MGLGDAYGAPDPSVVRFVGAYVQISPYEIALIGGGFTIIGALLGAWITYKFALQLRNKDARREAGRRLRETFSDLVAVVNDPDYSTKDNPIFGKALQDSFPGQTAAINELAFHLSGPEREKLYKAWRTYWEVGGSVRFFDYTMGENTKEVFLTRVNEILEFTKI